MHFSVVSLKHGMYWFICNKKKIQYVVIINQCYSSDNNNLNLNAIK